MREFDIRAYGAVGDGKTLNTTAIQNAIDACWDRKIEKPVVAHAENVVFHNTTFSC